MNNFFLLISFYSFLGISANDTNNEVTKSSPFYNITDNNLDHHVNYGKSGKWLLLFYFEASPQCKHTNDAIEKIAKENTEKDFHFGKIEMKNNVWSAMRFNITRWPYIVLIHRGRMFEMKSEHTEENILLFMSEEKKFEESMMIPKQMGYISLSLRIFKDVFYLINDMLIDYFRAMNITWTNSYSFILLGVCIGVFLMMEYFFLSCCCRKKNKKNQGKEVKDSAKKKK